MRPPDFVLPGYLHRWHLFRWSKRWPNVYLHHILAPDRGFDKHDHPAWSITIVLRGGFFEVLGLGFDLRIRWNGPGAIRFRRATEPHRIADVEPDTWTLWMRGGHCRKWGFWTLIGDNDLRWVPWDEYEDVERMRVER